MSKTALAVNGLARLYPYEVQTSEQLVDSLAFVKWPFDPETLVRAGYGAGIVTLLALLLPVLAGLVTPLFGVFALLLAVGTINGVHTAPVLAAAFRRTEALGDTPNLVGRAVLRMQIQPATETAIRFAADTGYGPLAESLGAHIDQAMGTPRTGLIAFAEDWAEDFPALRRSAHLLATAEDAPEAERARTLDRSLDAILNGTREQMAEFTNTIQSPTTALYAFGVMLPMALVALVPAVSLAGFNVSIVFFVLIYNLFLPVGLVAASVWLLVRRPVAFPPPDIDRTHEDVPNRIWWPLALGAVFGGGAAAATYFVGPRYLAPIAGIGLSVGTALLTFFQPIMEVRRYVKSVEEHLTDALYLVGRQVSEGQAVESAIDHAGDRVPGETGEVFEQAAGLQRRLHVSVDEAFFGEYGALNGIPSPRARGTASLLAVAADEGQPAGRAIVSMADHLEELQEVENEAKRQLSMVTGTLDNTAAYFGPMVAGSTVALAEGMVGSGGFDAAGEMAADPLPIDQLGLVVGAYVVLMSVILTTLSIGLRHGLDRSLVGYHVGRSLVSSTPLYVLAVFFVGMIM
ncbi:secretion system protein [Halosimplex sp. TS25]|uniref:secretion system protein n=1 Tax=Halosimplex rarum TaxID=3396619 RepID=UPI0039EC5EC4